MDGLYTSESSRVCGEEDLEGVCEYWVMLVRGLPKLDELLVLLLDDRGALPFGKASSGFLIENPSSPAAFSPRVLNP